MIDAFKERPAQNFSTRDHLSQRIEWYLQTGQRKRKILTLFDMGFFEPSVIGGGGGGEAMRAPIITLLLLLR